MAFDAVVGIALPGNLVRLTIVNTPSRKMFGIY